MLNIFPMALVTEPFFMMFPSACSRESIFGLIGANGEGKSTFMNIITGKLMPDEGKVEWAKNVRVGYLDQHTVLEKGTSIRETLASAFSFLFEMEAQMNEICDKMGEATPEELEVYMEDLGTIQDMPVSYTHLTLPTTSRV